MTTYDVGNTLTQEEGKAIDSRDFANIVGKISTIGNGVGAFRPAATLRYMADMLDQLVMQAALDMRKWEREREDD